MATRSVSAAARLLLRTVSTRSSISAMRLLILKVLSAGGVVAFAMAAGESVAGGSEPAADSMKRSAEEYISYKDSFKMDI